MKIKRKIAVTCLTMLSGICAAWSGTQSVKKSVTEESCPATKKQEMPRSQVLFTQLETRSAYSHVADVSKIVLSIAMDSSFSPGGHFATAVPFGKYSSYALQRPNWVKMNSETKNSSSQQLVLQHFNSMPDLVVNDCDACRKIFWCLQMFIHCGKDSANCCQHFVLHFKKRERQSNSYGTHADLNYIMFQRCIVGSGQLVPPTQCWWRAVSSFNDFCCWELSSLSKTKSKSNWTKQAMLEWSKTSFFLSCLVYELFVSSPS